MIVPQTPVAILDVKVEVVAYRGEPVVTFATVDRVHGRPDGTAGRAFRDNRQRFAEGSDFITLDQPDEIRRLGFSRPQGGTPGKVILITRRGYLKLVKPLTDDRAWMVQDEMVDKYFSAETDGGLRRLPAVKVAAEAFDAFASIARTIGLDRNQIALSANRAVTMLTGVDVLSMLEPELVAPQQERALTVTEVGQRLGYGSARATNQLLARHGFQEERRDPKDRVVWEHTVKGEPFAVMIDTGKQHGGSPVRQLKWSVGIVDAVRAETEASGA